MTLRHATDERDRESTQGSRTLFEADFFPVSYGFRPGKSVHGALEHLRVLLRPKDHKQGGEPRLPSQWIVEGDIKGCLETTTHYTPPDSSLARLAGKSEGA